MTAVIWSGAQTASDVFLLAAAICAGLLAVLELVARDPVDALLPVAICLTALGLLAL